MDVQQFANFSEEQYSNASGNGTLPPAEVHLGPATFLAPLVLMLTLITLPSVLLNVVTLITLARDSTVNRPTRVILSSLSANALLIEVGLTVWALGQILRALHWIQDNPASHSCRVPQFIAFTALYIRFLLNAVFAVVMYRIIKRGVQTVRISAIIIAIFVMSAIVMICNIPVFLPTFYISEEFVDGVGCNLQPRRPIGLLHVFGLWFAVSFSGTAVIVTFAALSYLYVKRHVAAETDISGCRRAMLRFSLSLIVTSILNIIAAFIPLTALGTQGETSIQSVQQQVAVRLLVYIAMDASVLPQPILMMILFKPLRQAMKDIWRTIMSFAGRIRVQQTNEDKDKGTTIDAANSMDILYNNA